MPDNNNTNVWNNLLKNLYQPIIDKSLWGNLNIGTTSYTNIADKMRPKGGVGGTVTLNNPSKSPYNFFDTDTWSLSTGSVQNSQLTMGSKANPSLPNADKTSFLSKAGNVATQGLGFLNSVIPNASTNPITQSLTPLVDSAMNALGPWGMAASAVDKIIKNINPELFSTDGQTTVDKVFDAIPGLGLVNAAFGKRTSKFNYDPNNYALTLPSYAGIGISASQAKESANKKYGLFSGLGTKYDTQQGKIHNAKADTAKLARMEKDEWEKRGAFNVSPYRYQYELNGNNFYKTQYGKGGLKFKGLEEARETLKKIELRKLQKGGKMNVIPSGALHSRLNKLSDVDDKFDGTITKKGIPVIVEGDKIEQQAEIEHSEIILHKTLTEQLEDFRKEKKPLEAGKLFVEELLYNTQDNVGLINTVD